MKLLRSAAFAIFFALICAGCSRGELVKEYAFTWSHYDFDTGSITSRFLGTTTRQDSYNRSTGSPYKLWFWFDSPIEKGLSSCVVSIESLVLKNRETGEVAWRSTNAKKVFRLASDGDSTAFFNYSNVDIEYVDHALEFTYTFGDGCVSDKRSVSVSLVHEVEYSEKTRTFWDFIVNIT